MLLMLAKIIFHKPTPTHRTSTLRCLCCPGAPLIEDIGAHTRLCHTDRARGPEDYPEWSTQ